MAELAKVRQSNKDIPLIENAAVAEVFTDSFAGLSLTHGNVHMTFATVRTDHGKQPPAAVRVVSSRLVMPLASAVEMHQLLGQLLAEMEKQGLVKRAPAGN